MLLLSVLELVALQHPASLKGWASRLLGLLHDTGRSPSAGEQWLTMSGKVSSAQADLCQSHLAERLHPVQQPVQLTHLAGRAAVAAQAQHMLANLDVADALAWLQNLAAQLHLMKEAAITEPASSPLLVSLCV